MEDPIDPELVPESRLSRLTPMDILVEPFDESFSMLEKMEREWQKDWDEL